MNIKDVSGERFPTGRSPQQKGLFPVGPGMMRQVVEDHEDIFALFHEILAHGRCRIGGEELQSGRVFIGGHHDDTIVHGLTVSKVGDDLGHRGPPFSDGAIDADDILVFLVDEGIQGKGGFSGLTVSKDEFALAPPNVDQGIHHLETGLQGNGDRRPVHD